MTDSNGDRKPCTLDRFDLTGRSIKKWRVPMVKALLSKCKELFGRLNDASATPLPGADESIKEQAKKSPGKLQNLANAKLEEAPVQNELRIAQTEKAYAEAELARATARREHVETAHREIDLYERLAELTKGKPLPRIVDQNGKEILIVADVAKLLEDARSHEQAE